MAHDRASGPRLVPSPFGRLPLHTTVVAARETVWALIGFLSTARPAWLACAAVASSGASRSRRAEPFSWWRPPSTIASAGARREGGRRFRVTEPCRAARAGSVVRSRLGVCQRMFKRTSRAKQHESCFEEGVGCEWVFSWRLSSDFDSGPLSDANRPSVSMTKTELTSQTVGYSSS